MPSSSKLGPDARITISAASELHSHFSNLSNDLFAAETEHTWARIEQSLLHIQAITRGGAAKFPGDFVSLLKDHSAPISNALLSERTKLSGTAGDLLNSIAPRLGEKFESLVGVFVPTLLLICARTNKVAVKRAEKSLHFIVRHCRPASIISYLRDAAKDKSQGLRVVAVNALVLGLEEMEKERLHRRVGDIEASINSAATDSNPEVRQGSKRLFELYVAIWPERVEGFTKPMTPTIRRYLALPKTGALIVDIPSPQPSKVPAKYQEPLLAQAQQSGPSSSSGGYNFFPDLQKQKSAPAPSFSVNDATYAKRGLFAEQIAAARHHQHARLARVPSFNFDEVASKPSNSSHEQQGIRRQPSFDQHPPGATFRVHRMGGDINAPNPTLAGGKGALLAAYKQAFVVTENKASSSKDRTHREKREKANASGSGEKRREKTGVRFEPEPQSSEAGAIIRSKSVPVISAPEKVVPPNSERKDDDWEEEEERPATPPERVQMAAQTPRTGVKASRVPAQRVQMAGASAVKVSAMRVTATPSAKIAAKRMAEEESSPVPKTKSAPRTPLAHVLPTIEVLSETPEQHKAEEKAEQKVAGDENLKDETENKEAEKKDEKVEEPEPKVPVDAKKAPTGTAPVKMVGKKSAPSFTIAAQARVAAKTAALKPATTATTKAVVTKAPPKPVSRPGLVVKKPIATSSTTAKSAPKPIVRPNTTAAKPPASAKPTTAPVFRTKVPASTTTAAAAVKKPEPTTRTSTLTASTASTRNKIVPSAALKKFAPKTSSLPPTSRIKSSIGRELGAKSKLVGASDKVGAVKKAAVVTKALVKRLSATNARTSQRATPAAEMKRPVEELVAQAKVVEEMVQEPKLEGTKEAEPADREEKVQEEDALAPKGVEHEEGQADKEVLMDAVVEAELEAIDATVESVQVESVLTVGKEIEQEASTAEPLLETTEPARPIKEEYVGNDEPEAVIEPIAVEQIQPHSCNATPVKEATPLSLTPARPRTPLSAKDTNLPRAPASPSSALKPSPLKPTYHSSPLRRLAPQYMQEEEADGSGSFSESEEEEEDDEVVQLHFRMRHTTTAVEEKIGGVGKKQIVVAPDSSDLSSEAEESDETVLLEEIVA